MVHATACNIGVGRQQVCFSAIPLMRCLNPTLCNFSVLLTLFFHFPLGEVKRCFYAPKQLVKQKAVTTQTLFNEAEAVNRKS